ncbi:MAG TPA: hypothetical protein VHP11_06000 [Tepidisphaeraceae bacterium]|nr:hypothetical protein [Tepidisphaeraceae bacterium]
MRSPGKLIAALAGDERGAEPTEYALIIGLIMVVALVVCTAIGTKVFGHWEPAGGR